ncbi:MAG: retropepsin-like aspartic protease, partial [Candidatus Thermoplasmatota archaeon]|nr:retropepsin-like aspartic protease [Candidatus Thermoplasmatota archaeon]
MLRREVVIEPDRSGMYLVDGYINGKSVKFCVDTGASGIVITDEKADAIGLDWRSGSKGHSNTVGGLTERWSMPLHSVRIGDIEVRKGLVGGVIPAMD